MWSPLLICFLSLDVRIPSPVAVVSPWALSIAKRSEETENARRDWLQGRLGMSETEIETLLVRKEGRSLLTLREENVGATLDWLELRLKLDQKNLKKLVTAAPKLVSFISSRHNRFENHMASKKNSTLPHLNKWQK